MDIVEVAAQFGLLLGIAAVASIAVTSFVETIKPLFLDPLDNLLPEGWRTPVIYIIRLVAGFALLSGVSEVEQIREVAPILDPVDSIIIVAILALFVALGSETIYRWQQGLKAVEDAGGAMGNGELLEVGVSELRVSGEHELAALRAEIEGLKEARKTDIVTLTQAVNEVRSQKAG